MPRQISWIDLALAVYLGWYAAELGYGWLALVVIVCAFAALALVHDRATRKVRARILTAVAIALPMALAGAETCPRPYTVCGPATPFWAKEALVGAFALVLGSVLLRHLYLTARAVIRFGAFVDAKKRGMTAEDARAWSEITYRPSRADLQHEAWLRDRLMMRDANTAEATK